MGKTPPVTIHNLNDDLLRLSHSFLGVGHFRYSPLACKRFLALEAGYRMITTGESVTSSISCAKKYIDEEGTDTKQLRFFWYAAARHYRFEVMQWAHQQGYSTGSNSSIVQTIISIAIVESKWLRLGLLY